MVMDMEMCRCRILWLILNHLHRHHHRNRNAGIQKVRPDFRNASSTHFVLTSVGSVFFRTPKRIGMTHLDRVHDERFLLVNVRFSGLEQASSGGRFCNLFAVKSCRGV